MSSRAPRVKRAKHTRVTLFIILAVFISFFALIGAGAYGLYQECESWLSDLPDYTDVKAFEVTGPTKIYAADHTTLLAELYLENRIPVTYDEISPYVLKATVSTEDVRFYEHNGVDYQGILRAIYVNITSGGTSEGASTITQQLVRNTVLLDEMDEITLKRKVREAYIAMQIEKIYSKDQILTMYLNTINYGDGCYGIEAASEHYFSKPASDLTLSEAALLAGIPQSPTRLNPVNNYEASVSRRNTVLERMLSNDAITQEEYDEAINTEVVLNLKQDTSQNGVYQQPYFVDYVKGILSEDFTEQQIFKGGLTVYTTLDMRCQQAADETCQAALEGQNDDVELALVTVDPDNGYILAMYGGKDYNADQFNLATQASRQCGSSFKAFTLCTAIEQGISPNTVINGNSPMTFGDYTVSNSEGTSYGNVTMKQGIADSINTLFVQVVEAVGAQSVVDMAHRLGIKSTLTPYLSITLGTEGVNPLEMADAYATFANGGTQRDPVAITQVLDYDGNVIYTDPQTAVTAISPEVCWATTRCLEYEITNGTGSPAALATEQEVAGKTGTTQNFRDAYFVGYTPQYSTAMWMGSREEHEVYYNGSEIYGGLSVCPIWKIYTDKILEGCELEYFPRADDPPYNNTYEFKLGAETKTETTVTTQTTTTTTTGETTPTTDTGNTSSETTTEETTTGGETSTGGGDTSTGAETTTG